MGRKNSKVRRANDRGRLQRGAREKSILAPPVVGIPRVKVEDMVLPDSYCSFQGKRKASFSTKDKAAVALKQARQQRARTGATEERTEKRFYPCPEGGCGGYHLTARSEFDEKLWRQRRDQFAAKTKNNNRGGAS